MLGSPRVNQTAEGFGGGGMVTTGESDRRITDLSVVAGFWSVDVQWVLPVCITLNEVLLQKR